VLHSIGPNLRRLRVGKQLSLHQLAEGSGVSAAAIHRIERSGMVPTVATLLKVATALERPLSYFTDGAQFQSPVTAVATPASRRRAFTTSKNGVALHGISGPYGRFFIASAVVVIEPRADSGDEPMRHQGEELIYLLEGALELEVDGTTFQLGPGDALHFRTDRAHRWRNSDTTPARALWMRLPGR
jgi:transcriptional regulator with XRE-family HTH domain